jgi:hypothetical protein
MVAGPAPRWHPKHVDGALTRELYPEREQDALGLA